MNIDYAHPCFSLINEIGRGISRYRVLRENEKYFCFGYRAIKKNTSDPFRIPIPHLFYLYLLIFGLRGYAFVIR